MQRILNNYDELQELLNSVNGNILFVHGESAFERFSRLSSCLNSVSDSKKIIHFTDFNPNPKLEDAKKANAYFTQNNCVFILGGGGVLQLM